MLNELNKNLNGFLVKEFFAEDYEDLFLLHQGNKYYNSLFKKEPITKEKVLSGLTLLPEGASICQKHYVGFYKDKKLCACADFVEKYPDQDTVFLGLLMVGANKRQGIGTKIIRALILSASTNGYKKIRLACLENNPTAHAFWLKQGFKELRQVNKDDLNIIIMEKEF